MTFRNFINLIIAISLAMIGCSKASDQLLGNWTLGENENVEFTILEHNQIKYFEDEYIYNYNADNNILSVSDSGQLISSYQILKTSEDSLVLRTENKNILRYVKID